MGQFGGRSFQEILFRYVMGFCAAVLTAFVLGSFFQTQMLINGITNLGFDIPLTVRVSTALRDFWGMGVGGSVGFFSGYLGLILAAFAFALPTARLLIATRNILKLIPGFTVVQPFLERIAYPAACAVAIWSIHYSLKTEYPAGTFFSGARGPFGLMLQILAGGVGGLVFSAFALRLVRTKAANDFG